MASSKSYKITTENNNTEKEALEYVMKQDKSFILPDKKSRKKILELLNLENRYLRAFDLIQVEGYTNRDDELYLSNESILTLIEIKSTKKRLENNPYGFFFGATENEFNLAQKLTSSYKFCFVCLHSETMSYVSLTLDELDCIIQNKRIQYQINLQKSKI